MARESEARAVSLVDLPIIRRLSSQATVLESAIEYTQGVNEPNTSTLTNLLLPNRSVHTLIVKADKQQVVGQFRLRDDEQNAHVVYLAPVLKQGMEDTAWLHMLDTMAREAGQRDAHALIAEVREDSCLFETMRTTGFAVYSRRQIWQRLPNVGPIPHDNGLVVVPESTDDLPGVHSLIAQIVPPLMQPFVMPDGHAEGWVHRKNGQITAYIAVTSGRLGIYFMPFIHPDAMDDTTHIIASLMRQIPKADRLPVAVCVGRYLDWMGTTLERMHFEPASRQAVMVRHMTAGVRQAEWKPVEATNNTAVAGSANPPSMVVRRLATVMKFLIGIKAKLKERIWKDMSLTI
jgi:hypothetical protein